MKRTLLLTIISILTVSLQAQKYVGGDISMLTKYEEANVVYRDKSGNTVQPLQFFYDQGLNAMRVRLFVDPSRDSDKGVCQDLDYVKALGQRIKATGFSFMLDFHYSDTWADPGKQWTPDAWKNLDDAALATKVYEYTKDCLQQLKAAGATPDFIQTGNEISYGMLWGVEGTTANRCYTNSSAANWNRFFNLLKQAGKACREVCPQAKIVLHSERVPKTNVLTDFFDRMKNNSIDYDIIGLSYYPDHHGSLATLETALNTLEAKSYGKQIMIVETGYGYKWGIGTDYDYTATYPLSEEGQRQLTADLITMLNKHSSVTGLFWWWPEDNGNANVTEGWWNAGLYNHDSGQPYAAFYELKSFVNDSEGPQENDITSQFTNMDFNASTDACPGWTINFEGWNEGPWPKAADQWHAASVSGNLLQGWCQHANALTAGNIISQSLEGLPAGQYTITAVVHTDYDGIYLFANDDTQLIAATSSWGTTFEPTVTTTLTAPGKLTLGLKLATAPTTTSEVNLYADNFKVTSQTTGIRTVRDSQLMDDGAWYMLDGRRIDSSKFKTQSSKNKGIYIRNGSKVVIR